jgi:hypothetical protein
LHQVAADAFDPVAMSDVIGDAAGGGGAAAAPPAAVREKPPISIYPQLKNVVSSVDLGTRIDLKGITMKMRNAECRTPAIYSDRNGSRNSLPQVQSQALFGSDHPLARPQDDRPRF